MRTIIILIVLCTTLVNEGLAQVTTGSTFVAPKDLEWGYDNFLRFLHYRIGSTDETASVRLKRISETEYRYKKNEIKQGAIHTMIKEWTASGKLSGYESRNKKVVITYDAADRDIMAIESDKTGRINEKRTNEFDERGNKVRVIYYGKRGEEIKKSRKKIYDQDDHIVEQIDYKGGDEKLNKRTSWTYHGTGAVERINHYNKKGKLLSSRYYTCNDEPEAIAKNTTNVCVDTETDKDGNRIDVVRSVDSKGRARSTKTTYDSKDHLLRQEQNNHKGTYWAITQRYDERGNCVEITEFSDDKEPYLQIIFEFSDENKLVKQTSKKKKGKISSITEMAYNTAGQMESRKFYSKGKGSPLTALFQYDDKGRMTERKQLNDKGQPVSVTKTETAYYE